MAELTKAANESEESVRSLAVHRQRAKEDRRMLNEEKRVSPCNYCGHALGVVSMGD